MQFKILYANSRRRKIKLVEWGRIRNRKGDMERLKLEDRKNLHCTSLEFTAEIRVDVEP